MFLNNYYSGLSKQEKILISSVMDKYENYLRSGKSTCTSFLNPHELRLVTSYLNSCYIPYFVYEPYSFFEKKILYFGNYQNDITFYEITSFGKLTHSQLLGSLFSIGFHENTIGDIFVQDGICYYVNLTRLNSYLEQNLRMVGKQAVSLRKIDFLDLPERQFNSFQVLVNSMRVDIIVSKITSQSRNQVKQTISDKKVFINYCELKNLNCILKEGDVLSIRKVGKFKIGSCLGFTKKGNLILEIFKYQ